MIIVAPVFSAIVAAFVASGAVGSAIHANSEKPVVLVSDKTGECLAVVNTIDTSEVNPNIATCDKLPAKYRTKVVKHDDYTTKY